MEEGGIGFDEKKIADFEEESEKFLTPEELEQRRGELAKIRSLQLYKELKHKHAKKIKSRKYRKMLKRAQDKEKLSIEELAVVDPEKYKKLLEERELDRIKERLTLKHSNKSKWAKRAIKQKDLNIRQAVQDQIQQGVELRRKISSVHDTDSESDSSDSDNDDQMNLDDAYDDAMGNEEKGIHGLKFMKRAAEKQKKEFLESLKGEEEEEDDGNVGRRKFAPPSLNVKKSTNENQGKKISSKKSKKSPLTSNSKISEDKESEESNDIASIRKSFSSKQASDDKNPWMNLKNSAKVEKKARDLEKAQVSSTKPEVIRNTLDINDVLAISEDKLEGLC